MSSTHGIPDHRSRLLAAALATCYVPLGDYMAKTFTSEKHTRAERAIYRVGGVDPDADQTWSVYLRSLLAFSFICVAGLYLLLRVQDRLPLSIGMKAVSPSQSFETASSFVTNTNWQSYAGESTMSHLSQMLGLSVQNFVSAAVGMAVAVALIRGFVRSRTDRLGNFWVDMTRCILWILLPMSLVMAIVLIAAGAVQNLTGGTAHTTVAGVSQTIVGGPIASQEAIKQLGTNGGGFFNANSAHPFENPNPFTNWLEIFSLLLIPVALTRTFGTMVGHRRQGLAILGAMAIIFGISLAVTTGYEVAHPGHAPQAAGAAMEGKEVRFGVPQSALFATATTSTSTGAVDSFHDSYTALGGGALMVNMMFGEVTPGGVGSGLYGILIVATMSVFIAGLMVGRTPEYLKKKISGHEIRFVALYILATPAAVLVGAAIAMALPRSGTGSTTAASMASRRRCTRSRPLATTTEVRSRESQLPPRSEIRHSVCACWSVVSCRSCSPWHSPERSRGRRRFPNPQARCLPTPRCSWGYSSAS